MEFLPETETSAKLARRSRDMYERLLVEMKVDPGSPTAKALAEDSALLRIAAEEIETIREALIYYAERRNHTTRNDEGEPMLWWNDAFDGHGPGARARHALGGDDA